VAEKITSMLKQNVGDANTIDEVLSFQLIEHAPAPEEVVKAALEGCLRKRRLLFRYSSAHSGQESERTVDPYHLLNYMGTWHLLGYCHSREEIRDFHLGRVRDARVLEDSFILPRDFDVIDYVTSSFGLYKGELKEVVTLRFTPEKARWIRGQVWHRDQKVRELPDGSLEMSLPVASYSEIFREVLKHGSGVEIIEPLELREMIREEALRVYEAYSR
jgi:predicted DNA-binding transcriptional regulator YafY